MFTLKEEEMKKIAKWMKLVATDFEANKDKIIEIMTRSTKKLITLLNGVA